MVLAPVAGKSARDSPPQGLALVLSSCGDWDNPAGGAVCLLCFAAMGSKAYDLATVGALA